VRPLAELALATYDHGLASALAERLGPAGHQLGAYEPE
jgi:hypothetical protein